MHKKGISLVFLAGVAFVVIFFVVLKFLKISSIIPNQVKTVSPLFIRKTYSSLKEALINGIIPPVHLTHQQRGKITALCTIQKQTNC